MPEFKNTLVFNGNLTSTDVLTSKLPADTQRRFVVNTDGLLEWGQGGSTATDVNLYRSSSNVLGTDDAFTAVLSISSVSGGVNATSSPSAFQAASFTGNVTVPNSNSVVIATPTNFVTTVPSGSTGTNYAYNPVTKFAWHDLLAFNRWWGAPTFETFSSGAWNADTLNNSLWAGLENSAITVIDGATKTAARWTWNSGNIAFCYVEWWLLGFTYAGATNSTKNFLVELSSNGTSWTTVHTSTGNTANAAPVLLYAPLNTADTWVRLTITVTNAITLPMSTVRALSARWGNQGGGSENTFPYSWDATQRMAIGAGAAAANAPLTIGTNTTANTGGLYFGTDTYIYRSASAILTTSGALTAAGTVTSSAAFNASGSAITFDTTVERAFRLIQATAWTDSAASSFAQIGPNTPNAGGAVIQGGSGGLLPRLQLNSTKIVAWDGAYTAAPIPVVATTFMAACSNAANIPLVARGFTSQSVDLQQWQNSTGTAVAKVLLGGDIQTTLSMAAGNAGYLTATISALTLNSSVAGIVVRGVTSQAANLQEWQNVTPTTVASVSPAGLMSFTGANAGAQKITNMANPTAAQDAATKTYVDGRTTGIARNFLLMGA